MTRRNGTAPSSRTEPPPVREQLRRVVSLLEKLVDRADTARLLDREEAAEVLGISVRKLDSLEEAGEIQAIRIGRSVRYHPDILDRFMRRRAGGDGMG